MAKWVRYEVGKRERKPHIRKEDSKRFKWWITVYFYDDKDRILGGKKYHYTTNEILLMDILMEKEVNLNRCYVKGMSLGWEEVDDRCFVDMHDASEAFFDGGVDFTKAHFDDGGVDFSGAQFANGSVIFNFAYLGEGCVNFRMTNFINVDVSFYFAHFGDGDVDFEKAQFNYGDISLQDAQFGNGDVHFRSTVFNNSSISCENTQFGIGHVCFDRVRFVECGSIFCDTQFDSVAFSFIAWRQAVDFSVEIVNSISFQECHFYDDIDFTGVEVNAIEFNNCTNHGYMRIKWKENNLEKAIEANVEDRKSSDQHHRAADTALLLKENFRRLGRYEDEDEAYYMYMKHQIRAEHFEKVGWRRILNKLKFWFKLLVYELIGGYGTRPVRIFYTMLATVGIFALIYHIILSYGGTIKNLSCGGIFDWKALSCSLYFSAITFLTIGYGDLSPAHWLVRMLASVEGLIGLLLISYFTIAFSRKVLR